MKKNKGAKGVKKSINKSKPQYFAEGRKKEKD